jgi:hypothetical protein
VLVAISGGVADSTAEWVIGGICLVLILAVLVPLVFRAERNTSRQRGSGLKRGKSERNAMSRIVVGLARWGGGGGSGGS